MIPILQMSKPDTETLGGLLKVTKLSALKKINNLAKYILYQSNPSVPFHTFKFLNVNETN